MAELSYTQNARVTINKRNATIKEILNEIEKQTDYLFIYNNEVNTNEKVSVKAKQEAVSSILNSMLKYKDMNYSMEGNHIILSTNTNESPKSKIEANNQQQKKRISGTVFDEKGQPIIGANIIEAGTTNGTVTDIDGKFSLSVEDNATIRISYIGYLEQEINTAGKTSFNITLSEDTQSLDELVVIGYGTIRKRDLTGSVGSIDSDIISRSSLPDATGALQGRIAGLNIERNVGKPGGDFDITIRGLSSINNSNTPLYVIDGIPTTSGISDLNPVDIEKIDVLKDASATAIYGSRGANGVVMVTTRKGKEGGFSISYEGYFGVSTPTNLPDMMNGEEYVRWRTNMFKNQGKSIDQSNSEFFTVDEWTRIEKGDYTDWIDLILRNGLQTSNTINASGGDKNGTFSMSIGQLSQEGVVPGEDYNRYNLRLNIDRKFGNKWNAGSSLYFTHSIRNVGSYETLRSTFRMPPIANPYDANGNPKFFSYRNDYVTNPMFEYGDDGELREQRRHRVFGNVYLQFTPFEGMSLRSQISPQMIYNRSGNYFGQFCKAGAGKIENTDAEYSMTEYFGYVWDNQMNYLKDIDEHSFNFSLVQSIQFEQWEDTYQRARNFPFNSKWYNLDAVTKENIQASQTDYRQRSLASFLGRLQYSYKGKYLFTASGRYDGSSRLAEGNKWAFFPSGAFAWRINEEPFFKKIDNLSNLKVRLSYGITGNDAVDIYGTQSNISKMYYDFGDVVSPAFYKNRLSNYNLTK
jgi:TonB-linked SusC/RagA family outer membrane protein